MATQFQRWFHSTAVVSLLTGLAACSGTDFTPAAQIASPHISHNVLQDAPRLVLQAEAGIHVRGEQDDMLRREAELPGFGGFFINADHQVVVYMKPSAKTPDALVRSTLYNVYLNRPERYVREAMANASNAQIRAGDYTLSELIAIENAIAHSTTRIAGYVGVGTDISRNRVVLGLKDSTTIDDALRAVTSLGVPQEAVIVAAWGTPSFTSNWNSTIRPLRGGIQLEVVNRTLNAYYASTGSVGFNVFANGDTSTNYLLTAAHLVDAFFGVNGQTGDTVYQPTILAASTPVGFVTNNPTWSSSCPTNPSTGVPYDLCPVADAMLITYANSVTGQRAIGTSDYEGLNGADGTQHIHGWYAIEDVAIPEYLPAADTGEIHKSGFVTGTTTGGLVIPVVQFGFQNTWGSGSKYILLSNVTRIDHMGWGHGDSGGSVFAENHGTGDPYYALGFQSAGTGTVNTSGVCTAGTACAVYFTRWSEIETALGLGTLNPKTYP